MPEDNNDFMGTSLHNYDTTENRMSNGGSNGRSTGGGDTGQDNGNTTPTWKVAVGLIWCIVFIVIAVSNNGRAGNPDNPGVALFSAVTAVVGFVAIVCGKDIAEGRKTRRNLDKAVGGFQNAVHTCRLRELMDFIEEERDTDLGRRLRRLLDHIDKTDFAQVNRIWRETPAGKKEMEELDKFNETHPN